MTETREDPKFDNVGAAVDDLTDAAGLLGKVGLMMQDAYPGMAGQLRDLGMRVTRCAEAIEDDRAS